MPRHEACRKCGGMRPRTAPDLQNAIPRKVKSWPAAGVVVALLSFGYLTAAIFWSFGGAAFPFGIADDPLGAESTLGALSPEAAPWIAVVAAGGLVVAVVMSRHRAFDLRGRILLVLAWAQAVAFTLIIPDGRPLIAAVHVPVLLIGLPFGWPPGVTIASQLQWPVINQAILMTLGVSWALYAIWFGRRARNACPRCGRNESTPPFLRPENAARWGRWAVVISIFPPAIYALTRYAWAVGLPLGVSSEFLTLSDHDPTIFIAGAFMATFALGGAALTLGLTQRWGEVIPQWIPWLGGRPVPIAAAVVPPSAAALLLTSGGVNWLRGMAQGAFPPGALSEDWATTAPGALFGLWGIALGIATYAYVVRRRGTCPRCGRA